MLLRLRNFVFVAITTCFVAGGYAAQIPNPDDRGNTEGGLANDISASLIVCGRGQRLISSFGHCSIHMSCPSANLDNYYTYLILASPDNVKRFFKEGVCTGHFEALKWDEFKKDYVEQNRPITEYKLNLTTDEVRHLWLNLDRETYNSTSREYSFLHSQCTSICADIIRASLINERIEYGELPQGLRGTLRDYADHSVASYPWYLFGFQSILGAEGEQEGTVWEKLAPADIYPVWSRASIVDAAGNRRPIFIGDGKKLFDGTYSPSKPSPLTPTVYFAILLTIALLLTVISKKLHKITWAFDALLLCLQTALGLFFTWLLLFSKASWLPGNLLPIVFNPIPILLWIFFHKKKWFHWVYAGYAVVLTAMIIATPFVPQLQLAHFLLYATFLVRVTALFLHSIKNNKK